MVSFPSGFEVCSCKPLDGYFDGPAAPKARRNRPGVAPRGLVVGTKVALSVFGRVVSKKVAPKEALWRVASTKVAPSRPLGALWMASGAVLKRSWELPEAFWSALGELLELRGRVGSGLISLYLSSENASFEAVASRKVAPK